MIRSTKHFTFFITSISRKILSHIKYLWLRRAYLMTHYFIYRNTKLVVHKLVRVILFYCIKTTAVAAQHVVRSTKTFKEPFITYFIIESCSRVGFRRTYLTSMWSISNCIKLIVHQFVRDILVYGVKTTVLAAQHVIRETKTFKALFITSFV